MRTDDKVVKATPLTWRDGYGSWIHKHEIEPWSDKAKEAAKQYFEANNVQEVIDRAKHQDESA